MSSLHSRAAPIHQMSQRDFDMMVGDAIHEDLKDRRYPVQMLADAAGVNERTAKNWWERKCTPQGFHLSKLVTVFPTLQARYREVCAMEIEHNPLLQQKVNELVQTAMKLAGGGK